MQSVDRFSELLQALDRGESLPSACYTDAAFLDKEMAKIFRKSWQYLGGAHQLSQVGDYMTGLVANIPIVVLRNEEGLAGFVNVCRHRRHEVVSGCGNAKIMQCPYHAWTYDLLGKLKAVPRSDREPDFCMDDYPLISVKVQVLGPWVFANVDEDCRPLEEQFGEVLDIIKQAGINVDELAVASRAEWSAGANWKTMIENFLECYHCPVAHPSFSAVIDVDQDNYKLTTHQWFSSQIGQVRQSALQGKSKAQTYNPGGTVQQAQYHVLWPNLTISINPGYPNLCMEVWQPDGPSKSKGFSEQYFGPEADKQWADELMLFNKQVAAEDDKLTDSVQRGLQAGIPSVGRFLTTSEQLCIHFQKLIVRALAKLP